MAEGFNSSWWPRRGQNQGRGRARHRSASVGGRNSIFSENDNEEILYDRGNHISAPEELVRTPSKVGRMHRGRSAPTSRRGRGKSREKRESLTSFASQQALNANNHHTKFDEDRQRRRRGNRAASESRSTRRENDAPDAEVNIDGTVSYIRRGMPSRRAGKTSDARHSRQIKDHASCEVSTLIVDSKDGEEQQNVISSASRHEGQRVRGQSAVGKRPLITSRHDRDGFTYGDIKDLLSKRQDSLKLELSRQLNQLKTTLKKSKADRNQFFSLVKLIAKALPYGTNDRYALDIVKTLLQVRLMDISIPHLIHLEVNQPIEEYDTAAIIKDFLVVLKAIICLSPRSSATMVLVLKQRAREVMEQLKDLNHPNIDRLEEQLSELEEILEKNLKEKRDHVMSSARQFEDADPPDNFRDIEIYPTLQEVTTSVKPFLRANKIEGGYTDLEQYLDIQYRLEREDFIGPLREGVRQYKSQLYLPGKKKLQDLRLYDKVTVLETACRRDGVCHKIQFDASKLKSIEWAHSKRLIFGSLLCFSSDDFNTILFATVAERDPKLLKQGLFHVSFLHNLSTVSEMKSNEFVMAESVAFFEAYRHVLKGLQQIHHLPFANHIVSCECNVEPPMYVRMGRNKFDLRPLIDRSSKVTGKRRLPLPDPTDPKKHIQTKTSDISSSRFPLTYRYAAEVPVLDLDRWPSENELQLDKSQYAAIQRALTNEFVVTQGPPGTGKTYIGLQIVKALLHNYSEWSPKEDRRSMLIVCYTNHALDQFLEGIQAFYDGDIVRVGGRSSSDDLVPCKLDNVRQRCRAAKIVPRDVFENRRDANVAMKIAEELVENVANTIKNMQQTGRVLHESILEQEIGDLFRSLEDGFWKEVYSKPEVTSAVFQDGIRCESLLEEWLGCGKLLNEMFMPATNELHYGMLSEKKNDATREEDDGTAADEADELIDIVDVADTLQADRVMERSDDEDEVEFTSNKRDNIVHNKENEKSDVNHTLLKSGYGKSAGLEIGTKCTQEVWEITKEEKVRRRKEMQRTLGNTITMTTTEVSSIRDVWSLDHEQRWRLYRYWVSQVIEKLENKKMTYEQQYNDCAQACRLARNKEDKFILRNASVIGMTTTGAARYQEMLQEIGPRIIVVEEAAEVMESHIITSLTRHCQHLILIGDHQQLRPNPTVYQLAKDFNLDISLFERMLKNGFPYDCLELQHRMRPDISLLMRHLYPNLRDHESVLDYEDVKGIASNVFFVSHSKLETKDVEQKSHANVHEAKYVVALCMYLLKQDYLPSQITVLTTYSAQLFALRKLMPKKDFEGVKVTVVDNFQGEESDIILLSLVRSNEEGKIGFMKIDNRICVALSRAKKGFYVIGNFNFLSHHSGLWKKIAGTLEKKNQIGQALSVYCQNHPQTGFLATSAEDFKQAPEGGCKRPCDARLDCCHVCTRLCHNYDKDHKEFECLKPCQLHCPGGHRCKKLCYESCGNCLVKVEKVIPQCQHKQMVPCYQDPDMFKCKLPCEVVLDCGHLCQNKCGGGHTCKRPVVKVLPHCNHEATLPCEEDPEEYTCTLPCKTVLECGHLCQNECGNQQHTTECKKSVRKTLPKCGHTMKVPCSIDISKHKCREKCQQPLPCGHNCTNLCSEPHTVKCTVRVRKMANCGHERDLSCHLSHGEITCALICKEKLPCGHPCKNYCGQSHTINCTVFVEKVFTCGHKKNVPCSLKDTATCSHPCGSELACGHKCSGNCSNCYRGKLHVVCKEKCKFKLICGHNCSGPCSTCPPCQEPCFRKCPHVLCKNPCGKECDVAPCQKACMWSCNHFQCKKTCAELCDRPVCDAACNKKLGCGHACVGVCGEPCPSYCFQCNKDFMSRLALPREKRKPKFIQLDCGHLVEVTSLDRWVNYLQTDLAQTCKFPTCLVCGKAFYYGYRYGNFIKKAISTFLAIKETVNSSGKTETTQKFINSNLCNIDTLRTMVSKKEKESFARKEDTKILENELLHLRHWIRLPRSAITRQEVIDVQDELKRLHLLTQVFILQSKLLVRIRNREIIDQCKTLLTDGKRLEASEFATIENHIATLQKSNPIERCQLVTAFAYNDNHVACDRWTLCQSGHVFQIDPTQEATCPRCRKAAVVYQRN